LTGKGVVVAIVDTGINGNIDPLIRGGKSVVIDSFELYGDYTHYHGTACASCIVSQDSIRKGIASGVDILDVGVFQSDGGATNWDILQGWNWVARWKQDHGKTVICSNSFGSTMMDPSMDKAANNMVTLYDIPMIVAAGNDGPQPYTIGSPGSAKNVLTVGAINDLYEIADFSSRGPTKNGNDKPDVCAPGVNINMYDDDGSTITRSGTSFATPITAGAVALIAEEHPMHSAEQLQVSLEHGADDRGAVGYDHSYGHGVVNLENSLAWINGEAPAEAYSYMFLILPLLGLGIITYPEWGKRVLV
jgi:serine protease AprX